MPGRAEDLGSAGREAGRPGKEGGGGGGRCGRTKKPPGRFRRGLDGRRRGRWWWIAFAGRATAIPGAGRPVPGLERRRENKTVPGARRRCQRGSVEKKKPREGRGCRREGHVHGDEKGRPGSLAATGAAPLKVWRCRLSLEFLYPALMLLRGLVVIDPDEQDPARPAGEAVEILFLLYLRERGPG